MFITHNFYRVHITGTNIAAVTFSYRKALELYWQYCKLATDKSHQASKGRVLLIGNGRLLCIAERKTKYKLRHRK